MEDAKGRHLFYWTIFILSLLLPHLDVFAGFIFFGFFLIPILLIFFLYYLTITIKGYLKEQKPLLLSGKVGLQSMLILVLTPVLSILVVDKFYRWKADKLIHKLETYKDEHGLYPDKIEKVNQSENIFNVHYIYLEEVNNYSIYYNRDALVRKQYYSQTNKWVTP